METFCSSVHWRHIPAFQQASKLSKKNVQKIKGKLSWPEPASAAQFCCQSLGPSRPLHSRQAPQTSQARPRNPEGSASRGKAVTWTSWTRNMNTNKILQLKIKKLLQWLLQLRCWQLKTMFCYKLKAIQIQSHESNVKCLQNWIQFLAFLAVQKLLRARRGLVEQAGSGVKTKQTQMEWWSRLEIYTIHNTTNMVCFYTLQVVEVFKWFTLFQTRKTSESKALQSTNSGQCAMFAPCSLCASIQNWMCQAFLW